MKDSSGRKPFRARQLSRDRRLTFSADSFEEYFANSADASGTDDEFVQRDRAVRQAGDLTTGFTQVMRMPVLIGVLFRKFVSPYVITQLHTVQQTGIRQIVQSTIYGGLIERRISETFDDIAVAQWRILYLHQPQQCDPTRSRPQTAVADPLLQLMDSWQFGST